MCSTSADCDYPDGTGTFECLALAQVSVCGRTCDANDTCPDGMVCFPNLQIASGAASICEDLNGFECATQDDCTSGICTYYGTGAEFGTFCSQNPDQGDLNLGDIHYDQHTITGNSGSRVEDMENVLRQTERGDMDTNDSAGAVVGMKACAEGVDAVAKGTITNKTILYPQLPDLPLTRIEDLPSLVEFSPEVKAEVESGVWSKQAEAEMISALLP